MGASGIRSVKIARATLIDGRALALDATIRAQLGHRLAMPAAQRHLSCQGLVGLNLAASDVPTVKQRLGIGTPLAEASPAEILALLTSGAVIELDNGWHLATARIAGDEVVELVLNGVPANREELRRYGLSEEIIAYKRRWFAVLEVAPVVLPRVLEQRRAVRDLTATCASYQIYLTDGLAPIDNNDVEQLMKQVALGRKNWLFVGSVEAGYRAADFLTLVSSAVRNNLDVWVYIKDVLDRLLAGKTDFAALRPDAWAAAHPEFIREYRIAESRGRADRKKARRANRRHRTRR